MSRTDEITSRINAAIARIISGQGCMRVPAEDTDPDLVLADCKSEITRLRTALAATGKQQVGEVQGDALATLAANWRACADKHELSALELDSIGDMPATVDAHETKSEVFRQVAAELDAALAARQPGAQEPRGHAVFDKNGKMVLFNEFTADGHYIFTVADIANFTEVNPKMAPLTGELLYAALPAQGIDLGQLTRYDLNDGWDRSRDIGTDKGAHLYEHDDGDWVKWEDVQTLIGQRDAAPGVGS